MAGNNGVDYLFTTQHPLGPIGISDSVSTPVLKALYDTRVQLHLRSESNPPTFIVGRRGSGKTALLLSRELKPKNLSVRLSAQGVFSGMQSATRRIGQSMILPVEGVAQLWEMLLWAPIITRLVLSDPPHKDDPPRAFQILWEETATLRREVNGSARPDDDALDFAMLRLIEHVDHSGVVPSLGTLRRGFRLADRPWSQVIEAAREVIKARGTPVFVLIDSLEHIGEHVDDIRSILQGLFHLVGQLGMRIGPSHVRIQCCFPSELWPMLDRVSANPIKDFSGRMVLRWHWQDLLSAVGMRLRMFLERHYPEEARGIGADDHERLLARVLPPSLVSAGGVPENTVAYILRHTQLLPRQVLYIFNEALHTAIARTGCPRIRVDDVLVAVAEAEATLCPEVFSAHNFRHPHAHDVARRLIPHLPFRFDDGYLHRMFNQAGIRKEFGLDYVHTREMLTDVGILGRFVSETERYLRAEFVYAAEGQMILSPDEQYCLHPLFVRQYNSRDALPSASAVKPVYPSGTPERMI
ncbi:P-loop ATPase, Sll1717 family [Nonomuraea sp. LPB2021202275-12-8]|uniref:P-loop ATPase, Sll1717 family n=1 Tax=Nonomuraea sp. LPB2021202275-12-8 TaxID=3120159 RepID=UPI00300C50BB